MQRLCPDEDGSGLVEVVDTDGLPSSIEVRVEDAQRRLNFEDGPVFRVLLLRCGERDRVLFTAHHLVVDGVSWRILLDDLQTFLAAPDENAPMGKTTSYLAWANRLRERAATDFADELVYWDQPSETRLPRDHQGSNTVAGMGTVEEILSVEETSFFLSDARSTCRAQVDEILLTGLTVALGAWVGRDRVDIELEGHGRDCDDEDVDLSRTVGWFTTRYPVSLPADGNLVSIKDEIRSVPNRGLGWGVLRYLSPQADTLARRPSPPATGARAARARAARRHR